MVWPTIAAERENGDISDSCEAPSGPIRRIRDVPVFPHVPRWILPLLIAALAGRFMVSPLEYQSHDLIVFALIVLAGYAMARRRDAWAGTWAGLAAACKATPLIFLPLFCWQRRDSAAACFLAALIAATLAPDLLFPPPNGRPWVVHWYETFISKIACRRAGPGCRGMVQLEPAQPKSLGDHLPADGPGGTAWRKVQRMLAALDRRGPPAADARPGAASRGMVGMVYVAAAQVRRPASSRALRR